MFAKLNAVLINKSVNLFQDDTVRWANVTSAKGLGLFIKKEGDLFQVTALLYSYEEMTDVEYKIDLPKSKGTVLCISHKTLGVGSRQSLLELKSARFGLKPPFCLFL